MRNHNRSNEIFICPSIVSILAQDHTSMTLIIEDFSSNFLSSNVKPIVPQPNERADPSLRLILMLYVWNQI